MTLSFEHMLTSPRKIRFFHRHLAAFFKKLGFHINFKKVELARGIVLMD